MSNDESLKKQDASSSSNSTHIMGLDDKYHILTSIGEECIDDKEELRNLLAETPEPICYDRFEPSGRMTISGVMKMINVKKMISAGCRVKIVIADWFAMLNNKMGGDLKKIEDVGKYLIEICKAAAAGMDLESGKVEFLWSSKEINARADEYWPLVMDIAGKNSLNRITRCCQNMDRYDPNELTAAQILNPLMQCADIFFLKADICQQGMDQREVNVLAREYCDATKTKNKPIILSHHMLPGLQQGQEKMSKSDPTSSIFMEDDEVSVKLKIKKAYCPPSIVQGNPCLEYVKYIVFPWFNEFTIERSPDHGGNKTFKSLEELIVDYESGELHPSDLKTALAKALNRILEPVRRHFAEDKNAKELLKRVKQYCNKTSADRTKTSICSSSRALIMESKAAVSTQAVETMLINDESQKKEDSSSSNSTHAMGLEEKYQILRSIGEECIMEDELRNLLAKIPEPICYDGFEPSGRMHIAQGIMKTLNVNKMTSTGCRVKIWIADWFAMLNNKMGGDPEKIEVVGKYFIEIWKAAGMDLDSGKVEFLWSSKEINARADEYWPLVMNIARKNSLNRITRCCQIMGRNDKDELTAAQILYPCMQCADIFFLKASICQLGMDQRKVNVLAREYCDDIKRKNKPIILSHHMLPGLQQGQEKMSKSDPTSSIFMEDDEESVKLKIEKAYCPPSIVQGNPCLEYIKYIVFPWFNEFTIRPDHGGDKTFKSFEELIANYESGELHPDDLKTALAEALNKILEPVRRHFAQDKNAKALFEKVKEYNVTR